LLQIKVEILIPLNYNDGSPVEDDKLIQTYDEIVERFTACSMDNSTIKGRWMNPESKVYHDDINRSIWIICDNNEDNRMFFRNFKQGLQERFKQDSILICINDVSVI